MELTSDLIAIQSILANLIKNTGDFTRVNYKGGNEDIIMTVMIEIQTFLKSKNYITKDNKPNEMFNKELEDIVLFLALNTTFKTSLTLDDYSHLLNITPPLSKCLFVNVVYGLDLCKYYCNVIDIFPIKFSVQLLDEVLQCLKKSTPNVQLVYTNMFLKAAAKKLVNTSYCTEVEDDIDSLCEVSNMILFNLSGINSDQLKNLNQDKIYKHMGFCLLTLFELLLQCDKNCLSLKKFITYVIKTCSAIIQNVTLNVFCTWAEINIDDEILQIAVANKAYLVLQTYQKYPEASELISMLGILARKPKSLTEQIYEADINTIIKKINKKDQDQTSWFRALLKTQIFENKKALECVRTWSHLCNENDVSVLLNWCIKLHTEESVSVFIRCASNLTLEELKIVATSHFYKNKFLNLATTDVEENLTRMLNKFKEDADMENDLTKDVLILFIQQPEVVLSYLYKECLKNNFYLKILTGTFDSIKEIVKIIDMGSNVFLNVARDNAPNSNNLNNYIELLKTLNEIHYFTNDDILLKILNSMLNKCYCDKLLEELDLVLQMFLGISLPLPLTEDTLELTKSFLNIMNEFRCKFLNFVGIKQQIAKHTVDICCDICKPTYCLEMEIHIDNEDDFTRYYKLSMISGREKSIFQSLCTDFNINNYGNCLNTLLKVLPPAVNREWLEITQEIIHLYGNDKCLELLTDTIILLSQLVETQDVDQNKSIFMALKYAIQNYGLAIQQKFLLNSELDTEISINKQICRLLAKLPASIKEEEGLSLVNVLTDRSLKALAKDKDFLCQLIIIKNNRICQVLAQKIKE
ncbi:unnamed protein product [Psylliodes chrysocephalus]|uniref:Uncharacterized protein n=1 Tax=Psylliodes chrysocephalus TaxID=3402493 RepID=A0A9P0CCE8_9CUCU|nr:unnamed protein product [Psylliodes chrysocephala]